MLDQPGTAVGHQGVAITSEMVEPDLGDDGEVGRDVGLVRGQAGEKYVGDVMPHHWLDVNVAGDVPGDTAEEGRDLGSPPQWLDTPDLGNTIRAECFGKPVEPASITRPVVPRESVADLLTGDQFPDLHRRDSSPDRSSHGRIAYHPSHAMRGAA